MKQLTLNITDESELKVIASSAFNFRIERILKIGKNDISSIFEVSKDLAEVFGNRFLLNENNVDKIKAGTHPYDGTVRPQFVNKDDQGTFYDLIK